MKAMKAREGRGRPKRRSIPTYSDPYLRDKGAGEMAMCRMCQAVFHNKRWYLRGEIPLKEVRMVHAGLVLCPACRKMRDHFPGGVLTLRGGFLEAHKEEILNRAKNEESRAKAVNPLERIISIKEEGATMEIHTTNEKLAQRIGREIQRAFKGHVAYHWSRDDKLVRVEWEREA